MSIYLDWEFSRAELTSSRHAVLSVIAALISETDSRPVSFFRLSMKGEVSSSTVCVPSCRLPQHNFGCFFLRMAHVLSHFVIIVTLCNTCRTL